MGKEAMVDTTVAYWQAFATNAAIWVSRANETDPARPSDYKVRLATDAGFTTSLLQSLVKRVSKAMDINHKHAHCQGFPASIVRCWAGGNEALLLNILADSLA